MATLTNTAVEPLLNILWTQKKDNFDAETQELFEKYGNFAIKHFEILSGVTEMKLLKIENRLRWEQTQILLDFCQNMPKQGDEYYQFCSQRARESGMKENKKIIRAGE